MFRSVLDHPQGAIYFFLRQLLKIIRKENKYLPEDGQELTETCRRIIMTFKQYIYFNVLFLIKKNEVQFCWYIGI